MKAEIKIRALRILLIVLAIVAPGTLSPDFAIDGDAVAIALAISALILPPILQGIDGLGYWDWLQIAAQILGPAGVFMAATIEGPHGYFVFPAVAFYGIMILAVLAGDMIGISRQWRGHAS